MTTPSITVDLVADYLELLLHRLREMVTAVPVETTSLDEVSYVYWNACKRHIPIRPRAVHLAREFRLPGDGTDLAGVELLLGMFRAGADVNPHLSRCAKNPKPFPRAGERHKPDHFHDGLLNDWDIQHFHWDDGTDEARPRSSMLLFATVKFDDVYVIDVLGHRLWARQDVLERVHLNWPFLLEAFKHPREDKVAGFQPLTDQEIGALRRKGYSTVFTAQDGTDYFPPGGGQVSAGIGLDVVLRANRAAGVVSHWNREMKVSHEAITDLFGGTARLFLTPSRLNSRSTARTSSMCSNRPMASR